MRTSCHNFSRYTYITLLGPSICGRIAFSYFMSDSTHVQANLWHLISFVLIIPSLPPSPNVFPQLITYSGFYDSNLEFVGLEGVQMLVPWPCLPPSDATPSPPNWPVWSASTPWATLTATSWKPSTAHTSLRYAGQHWKGIPSGAIQGTCTLCPPLWSDCTLRWVWYTSPTISQEGVAV